LILRVTQCGQLQDQGPWRGLVWWFLEEFDQLSSSDKDLSQVLKNNLLHRLLKHTLKFLNHLIYVKIGVINLFVWFLLILNNLYWLQSCSRSLGGLLDRQSGRSVELHYLYEFRLLNLAISVNIQSYHAKFQICWCDLFVR
jgi:hypothetical protein